MSEPLPHRVLKDLLIHDDPWKNLRQFTDARIGIGRAGTSIPTNEMLAFQLSHAQAIDAVHVSLDVDELTARFAKSDRFQALLPAFTLHSKADSRVTYLQRPDFGRQLCVNSENELKQYSMETGKTYDLAIVVADGLSSYAIKHHAVNFLEALLSLLENDSNSWCIAPIAIVAQGRVAIGDDVGEQLNAKEVLVLIGERPGLSSPDSLGLYMTWQPKRGTEDASRNCISNIRPEGLSYQEAAHKAYYLLTESRRIQLSGVGLKDRSETLQVEQKNKQDFCLTTTPLKIGNKL